MIGYVCCKKTNKSFIRKSGIDTLFRLFDFRECESPPPPPEIIHMCGSEWIPMENSFCGTNLGAWAVLYNMRALTAVVCVLDKICGAYHYF